MAAWNRTPCASLNTSAWWSKPNMLRWINQHLSTVVQTQHALVITQSDIVKYLGQKRILEAPFSFSCNEFDTATIDIAIKTSNWMMPKNVPIYVKFQTTIHKCSFRKVRHHARYVLLYEHSLVKRARKRWGVRTRTWCGAVCLGNAKIQYSRNDDVFIFERLRKVLFIWDETASKVIFAWDEKYPRFHYKLVSTASSWFENWWRNNGFLERKT